MKQTLLTRLVLGAIAGLAATGAYAGQIQASSVSIAREVITTDTQAVTSPSVAYRFAGDVDARVQAQTFQVQFTVAAGSWAAAPGANAISISDGVDGSIQDQSAAAPVGVAASYQVIASGLSADGKTMWASITVNQGATALIKQPIIALNVTSNTIGGAAATDVSAARGTIKGLFTVVGDIVADFTATGACEGVKTLPVSFKHYTALTSPAAIATDANATPDEHTRSGATNTATLMTFPTNVKVSVVSATGAVGLTPGGNMTFQQNAAGTAFVSAARAMLGTVTLVQNAIGYDSGLVNSYLLTDGAAAGTGLDGKATATRQDGGVEVKNVRVSVTATNGFVVGGTLALSTTANCIGNNVPGTGTVAITAANAAGPIDLVVPTAVVNATFGTTGTGPVFVCYVNPGNTTIPSSQFSAVATVEKAAAGAGLNEQNNVCKGTYIGLGGGIKIDVRNYASTADTPSTGYKSIVRFINNSDTKTADVWGQIIHQDGTYGGWGKIMDLAPRQVVNLDNVAIEAKLTSAPTVAAAIAGPIAPFSSAAGSPRLRVTSNAGDTLRVQNFLFNTVTNQVWEGSGSQAVDFDQAPNRAPASDGQYISQDAQSGLNGAQ